MEKLREGIVKMSNSDPNEPLSETQNSILQQHLDRFMSSLRTNPNLPPYAWFLLSANSKNLNPKRKGKTKRRGNSSITQKKAHQKEKDPRHEVHLEQPIKQCRGRVAKYKDRAKIDDGTISSLATKRSTS
ncbi:hypothetical protein MTR67_016193 [Solanum verrucosum]|uniref:Uncharacterized protein n=1 Tax=Solanum verrucosum TaxID=315347 RepID=A0AAF0TQB8_SOLVR|nr:hypothetical protein MTR67_016193 [Solanum verrucosum]